MHNFPPGLMIMYPKMILHLLLAACVLFPVSCGKGPGDDREQTVRPALAISDARVVDGILYIEADASTDYVGIKTNITDWTSAVISDGGGWLATEPYRDPSVPATGLEVVQKLKITAQANTAAGSRSAVVRVVGPDIERTFKVVQAAAGHVLTFDSPVYAAAAGETIDVAVTANVEYTVTMPADSPWIERVSSPDVLRFRVAENDGTQPRSASIVVAARDVSDLRRTLVVEQQGSVAAINVDGPQEIMLAWNDTELALNVTANVPWRIAFDYATAGQEWIWSMATRGMTAKQEKFALNPNTGTDPRTVTVQFLSDDASVSPAIMRGVRVTQGGYTIPGGDIFELRSSPEYFIGYARRDIVVEIRTGKQAADISRGALPDWIAAGPTGRTGDVLACAFTVAENQWPLARSHEITFTAGGTTLRVAVRQDGAVASYRTVDYNSLTGAVAGGDSGALCDFDPATWLTGGQAARWPKEWTFGLRRAAVNEFNQIIYYPVPETPAYGITSYELLACSHAWGTWYTVASGNVPSSLYQSGETMRKGHTIAFPTVENVRYLTLRVKNSYGGATFGASEVHFAYDYTQKIASSPSVEVLTASPVTIPAASTTASVAVAATTPYSVTLGESENGVPAWITYNDSASGPGALVFTAQANPGAERSATVTLKSTASGVNIQKSITITQGANTNRLSFLSPASGTVDLAASAGVFTVDLTTNLARDAVTADGLPYWLTLAEKSDISGGVRLRFSAAANSGGARSHAVTLSGGGRMLSLTVCQAAVAGIVPTLSLQSPVSGAVSLEAYSGNFTVVLATNMGPADITAGGISVWLTAATPVHGNGMVTYTFTAGANPGVARSAMLTFSVEGLPAVSVTVSQPELVLPGNPVTVTDAVYYDRSVNPHDAFETADGDKATYLTLSSAAVWGYEFRFPHGTDLVSLIYYPRDSETGHGTLKKTDIQVVCHDDGTGEIESYVVEIPASVYATAAGRRAGYRIDLPNVVRRVSHLRIKPVEGYEADYSIAEVEFFSPK